MISDKTIRNIIAVYLGYDASQVIIEEYATNGALTKYSGKVKDKLVFEIYLDKVNNIKRYHCYNLR